jgi:predicted ATPase
MILQDARSNYQDHPHMFEELMAEFTVAVEMSLKKQTTVVVHNPRIVRIFSPHKLQILS